MYVYLYLHEPALHLQLDHLEGAAYAAAEYGAIAQIAQIAWQLYELGQRICVEEQRELVGGGRPIGYGWLHV